MAIPLRLSFLRVSVGLILFSLIFLLGACRSEPDSSPSPDTTVVIRVGDRTVMQDEFQREYDRTKNDLVRSGQIPSSDESQAGDEEVRARIIALTLEKLAHKLLVREEAERRSLTVTPTEVDAEVALLQLLYGSSSAYQWSLIQTYDGNEWQLRLDLEDRLSLEKVLVATDPDRFQASDEDLARFYQANPSQYDRQEQLQVARISVSPEDLPPSENLSSGELDAFLEGEGNAEVLGYLAPSLLPPDLATLMSTPVGQWIRTSETPTAAVFFKVMERVPAARFDFSQIRPLVWRAYYKTTTEELLPSLYDLLGAKIPVEVSTP